MVDRRILPAAQAQLIDKNGRATPALYDFMRRLTDAAAAAVPADITSASFLTRNNETNVLPNSLHLAEGANITLTQAGDALLIAASLSGGGSGDGYPAQLGYAGI